MKILVAGGGGYIGSRLVPRLLELGYEVTVVDLFWFGNYLPFSVSSIKKDIFELEVEDLKEYDQVVFLAGLSNDPMADYSPAFNFVANTSAPAYLAFVSKKAGVQRFVYADSCSVYGFTEGEDPSHEESRPLTIAPYGVSKLQGEYGVLQYADEHFSVICLRQGTVSGVSPRMRFDLLVNTMYMYALTERKITVTNSRTKRPLLSIADAVRAYECSIKAPQHINGVFNISSENYYIEDVACRTKDFLKEQLGMDIEIVNLEIPEVRNYITTNAKAKEILGVPFSGTVENVLEELSSAFSPDFSFDKDRYYNIKVFKTMNNSIGGHNSSYTNAEKNAKHQI